jgi:type IV secretion system protein VirB10
MKHWATKEARMVNDPNDPNAPSDDNAQNNMAPETDEFATPRMDSSNGNTPPLDDLYSDEDQNESEVLTTRRGASVAIGSGKTMLVFVAFFVGVIYLGYIFFSGDDKSTVTTPTGASPSDPLDIGSGGVAPSSATPSSVNLPPPPSINVPTPQAPAPPPPPPPPPPEPEPVAEETEDASAAADTAVPPPPPPPPITEEQAPTVTPLKSFGGNDKERQQRLRAGIVVSGGSGSSASEQQRDEIRIRSNNAQQLISRDDPNIAYMRNVLDITPSEKSGATHMTNLNTTIAQGKMVEAVLETAMNTDLPGSIRAIVSRDVYAEAGRNVLIPKGSRLIGVYNTGVFRGQKRVMVVWTRLMRPDGIDIAIGSPATDALGRAGIEGLVDNKYMESFSTAILTSLVSLGVAAAADNVVSDGSSTTRNTDGSSTTTGSSGAAAATEAVNNIGDVAKSIVRNNIDLRPTIVVDQGTRINVFVNRDLVFDSSIKNGGVFE